MANVLESKSMEAAEGSEDKQSVVRRNADQARRIQALTMMRARIREQLARTSNERYTELLNSELQQIEGDLQKLA
jgi:hypothetical protein